MTHYREIECNGCWCEFDFSENRIILNGQIGTSVNLRLLIDVLRHSSVWLTTFAPAGTLVFISTTFRKVFVAAEFVAAFR